MAITRKADSTSRTPLWTSSAPNGLAFVRADYPVAIAANSGYNFGYTTFQSNDEQNILHQPPGFVEAQGILLVEKPFKIAKLRDIILDRVKKLRTT